MRPNPRSELAEALPSELRLAPVSAGRCGAGAELGSLVGVGVSSKDCVRALAGHEQEGYGATARADGR